VLDEGIEGWLTGGRKFRTVTGIPMVSNVVPPSSILDLSQIRDFFLIQMIDSVL
jgi:hypothetical protein